MFFFLMKLRSWSRSVYPIQKENSSPNPKTCEIAKAIGLMSIFVKEILRFRFRFGFFLLDKAYGTDPGVFVLYKSMIIMLDLNSKKVAHVWSEICMLVN